MEYYLNNDNGINDINKIDLKKILEKFGKPDEVIMERDEFSLSVKYVYKKIKLEVSYTIYYFVNKIGVDFHILSYMVEKLFLTPKKYIKIGEDLRETLVTMKKYYNIIEKEFEFEYNEDKYGGEYHFDDIDITLFFEKRGKNKYLENIFIGYPHEDNPKVPTLEELVHAFGKFGTIPR